MASDMSTRAMISSEDIKRFAYGLGFHAVGVVRVRRLEEAERAFRAWREAGYHGGMKYLEDFDRRAARLHSQIPDARSVIVLGVNYFAARPAGNDGADAKNPHSRGRVARYAWGRDYHHAIRKRLESVEAFIRHKAPPAECFLCVDTQPVFERAYAEEAGLGFRGRQTNLLSKDFGPWLFLSEIFTNLALDPDGRRDHGSCGTCAICIQSCPTGAILENGFIDARKCIAYLTIEHRGMIPRSLRPLIGDRVFGCDECLAVCPFTSFSKETSWPELGPEAGVGRTLETAALFDLRTNRQYERRFQGTALLRATRKMMLRNAAVVLGNAKDRRAMPVLARALREEVALVRLHAAWALGRIGGPEAERALEEALGQERDPDVIGEIHWALEEMGIFQKDAAESESQPAGL